MQFTCFFTTIPYIIMKALLSKFVLCAVIATLFLSLHESTVNANPARKTIKIKNTTNFDIDEIHISDPADHQWGADILDPNEVLTPGEVIEVEVDCGKWDVLLVAPDKSKCEIYGINLCGAAQWNITAQC